MKPMKHTKLKDLLTRKSLRVYTYQHINVLEGLLKKGYITGDHNFSYSEDDEVKDLFKEPYAWMRKQMKERIIGHSGEMPVWAYPINPKTKNIKKSFGFQQIQIIAKVPRSRCLVSYFDLWEYGPLNKGLLSHNIQKMEDFYTPINEHEKGKPLEYKYKPAQKELEKGWEMIFDLDCCKDKDFAKQFGLRKKKLYLQVCVDRIYLSEISNIKIC